MFILSMGAGQTMGMPDVCLTPMPAPVPVPYPNIGLSSMAPEAVMTVLTGCTPTLNQMSNIAMTSGNEPGVGAGVVSHMIKGQNMWIMGSTALLVGGMPAMRLTSLGGGNSMGMLLNCPSTCIVPSQCISMVLR
jgi:hypothetical protein